MKQIITFGEIMMRFSTPNYARFQQAQQFNITFGGGEANVGMSLAQFGLPTAHVTRFPAHDIGRTPAIFLQQKGVDTSHIVYGGERLGVFYLETGAAMRPSKIVYDRFDSAFATLNPKEFDWEKILANAQWFHFTGITPAISQTAADACLQAVQTANRLGITVSADVNYRKNLWQYGKSVKEIMPAIVECCDIIVCGKGDAEDIFDIVPQTERKTFISVCQQIQERFPRVKKILNTKRGQKNASQNDLTGYCWNGTELLKTETIDIPVIVDRIGGGDAFMAGYIYGAVTYQNDQKAIDFAVAASALKHTIEGDANLVSVAEVEMVMNGDVSGRLKR